MPENRTIQKRFLASIIFGIIIFFGLVVFGDAQETVRALGELRWTYIPLIFSLAVTNYLIRFIRWHYLLRKSDILLPLKESMTVFFAGLSMSITPGKLGELMKAYFVKTLSGTPMHKTIAVVFAERFSDLFSIVILATVGSFGFHYGQHIVRIGGILVATLLLIVMSRPIAHFLLRWIGRLPALKKLSERSYELYDHSYRLMKPTPLFLSLLLGLLAWLSECLAFYFVFASLQLPLSLMTALFIYAFSTLFGAITFLPGGLATTEGSMTGLLLLQNIPKDSAAAATIVVRLATLWFAVIFGLLWMIPYRKMLTKLPQENLNAEN